jgi:3-phytase
MRTAIATLAALALGACATDAIVAAPVPASRETAAMTGAGDRADDPAVWVNPLDPARSLILATNKDEGLYVYGLDGAERQRLAVGLSNNVDLRGNLAVVSNDGINALSWFRIDPATLAVTHAGDTKIEKVEPYGVCAGVVGGVYQAAVTFKDGTVEIFAAEDSGSGPIAIRMVRSVKLGSQVEGCVFDEQNERIFVAEEDVGIWSFGVAGDSPTSVDTIAAGHGLVADVEGMSLWRSAGGSGFLVASAQSKDRFVIYDRLPPHAMRGVITVAASRDGAVDAASHTDGLDISSAALPSFPRGVLVVQDDANPTRATDQNFKIVDWREVETALGLASQH